MKRYFIQLSIVESDTNVMIKPGFDLIFGSNTVKELGIELDFWTKEIKLNEISLPITNTNKLKIRDQIKKS